MLQKNTFSPFRKLELSCLHALSFISLVALILFISTTNIYSAQVTLAWDKNTESNLVGYKIYSGSSSGNYDNVSEVGNQTSYTIQNIVEGQAYYFAVTGYDTFNNESGYSAEVAYTVPILDLTAPSTPTNLQATAFSTSQISLFWNASTDNVGVTGYRIYRDGTELTTTAATTYSDTGLSATTAHTYTVSAYDAAGNESGQSSASSATILSLPVNNPPTLDPIANVTLNEGETVTLNPTATDQDGDALTYTYTGWTSSSSYITNYDDSGTHTVTVTVSDGILTDTQDVTVTVTDVELAPVLDSIANITVNEGEVVTFSPTATDPDGDTLTYTYSGWMTSASYVTGYDDAGTYTVTVTVSDGNLTDSQDVTVTVAEVDVAPVLNTIADITVNEGVTITFNPTASDTDGDNLTFSYSGWMTSNSYTTNYTDAGTHTVTVTVSDGTLTDSQVVSITVINTDVSQITILWDANTQPELAGYKVYYGTSSQNYDTVVDVSTQTSYVLSNLVSGETYYMAVTAYNTSNYESTYTNEVIYNVPTY